MTFSDNRSLYFYRFVNRNFSKEKLKNSLLFVGLVNLILLISRSGTKPSRLTYPCQRAALDTLSISLISMIPVSITTSFTTTLFAFISKNRAKFLAFGIFSVVIIALIFGTSGPELDPFQEIQLKIEPKNAIIFPASNIFAVKGRESAHMDKLISLMSSHNFFFYKSNIEGKNQGPEGLIGQNDVVLLKINSQWSQRGGTNTDLLKEVIQAIISHPDNYTGEIVIADNGQGIGSMDFLFNNAENDTQSVQNVVSMFSSEYTISTYVWQNIRGIRVDEFSEGDMRNGYLLNETADSETGIQVSYPKFKTDFGTNISFKYGIWNGTGYEKRLKIINMPILKSHLIYGVTASLKNYMGVQSEGINGGIANGHVSVATGGMGTLMIECGLPTLNIIDAIWVNANPWPSNSAGPSTSYYEATRVNTLIAGVDPVALDYWAAKNILIQTANLIGYTETYTLDPDNTEKGGLDEAFGVWLNRTKNEFLREGYNFTSDENRLNVFIEQDQQADNSSSTSSTLPSSTQVSLISSTGSSTISSSPTPSFGFAYMILSLAMVVRFLWRKRRK
ncbi:MAG: DUF362 domain-containing protein [Candidatus Hodarchaeales archaeon]|jgi:hypothetical protein